MEKLKTRRQVDSLALLLAVKAGLKPPLVALLGEGLGGAVRYFLLVLTVGIVWPLTFPWFAKLGRKDESK